MNDRLVDAADVRHRPAGADARIVSLVPSITETLIEFGLADQLVGRTHFCIHPADAVAAIPSVGGTKKIKLSRLRELAPTHVILNVDENTIEIADAVAEFVPHSVVTHPIEPRDNLALYRLLGGIFGREREAEAACAAFGRGTAALKAKSWPLRRVLYLIWREPWRTVSRDTYISRLLDLVNWRTVCHDPDMRYPAIEIDTGLLRETDIILFSTEPFSFTEASIEEFRARYGAAGPRLALFDGEYGSWYGTRAIRALDYLAEFAARAF